jgi:hypothetical protein
VTGFPEQPTATSAGDVQPAEVMGQPVERDEAPDAPAEAPPGSVPEQKATQGTSETMPATEGIYRPEDHDDTPE